MPKRRVVITGMGVISPVGNTISDAWTNILNGKSGITRITRFDASAQASQIAGEVKDFDVSQYISVKDARRMDIFIHYGMAAAIQAVKDAGIENVADSGLDANRIGVNIGSGIGGLPMIEHTDSSYHEGGPRKISPFFIPSTIINMIAGNLSIKYNFKGPNLAIATACSTATHCIGS
ncbi:MAG: beta-ketoacyl synthase N-terminal-like domain-containing protein, partial [Nitrosomonadaceae bacterium]